MGKTAFVAALSLLLASGIARADDGDAKSELKAAAALRGQDDGAAYEKYSRVLTTFGDKLQPAERVEAERAKDELQSKTGSVAVFINVPDAGYSIDGKDKGKAPGSSRVGLGKHKVVVRAPGYAVFEQSFETKGGDSVSVNGPLVKAGEEPPPVATKINAPYTVEPPPVASTAEQEKFIGVYGRVEIAGIFPTGHDESVSDGDVYGTTAKLKGSGLYGGGVGVHVGYSFGQFGIEGLFLAAYDHSAVQADLGTRKDNWQFYRSGAVLGVEGRFMPHFDQLGAFRPTAGAGIGLAGRTIGYQRLIENTTTKDKASFEFYMAPSLMFDIGFTIGQTPGAKFYMGFLMQVEFPGGTTLPSGNSKDGKYPIARNAKVEGANGVEIFIGPALGLAFGH